MGRVRAYKPGCMRFSGRENTEDQRSCELVTHPESPSTQILAYLREIIFLE